VKDQRKIPMHKRVPTWVDMWARGLDVDVTIFHDHKMLNFMEDGRPLQVIERGKEISNERGDTESLAVFSNSRNQLELLGVIMSYYSQKPSHMSRRYGDSDRDQINEDHPNYRYEN
jgi:hypothetical protein